MIDVTKPLATNDGRSARYVGVGLKAFPICVEVVSRKRNAPSIQCFSADGLPQHGADYRLINVADEMEQEDWS